ncbi:MAG: M48 family metalloprotease [Gammaproteobacteria bacterium]|nr:M48 family metalloprotease [Gammaproteobacteria bacterium]
MCLLSILAITGCSVNPVTGEQDLVLMSEDQELSIGRATHAEILREYGEYKDAKLATYVQNIGERVAKNSHRADLFYRFTILDSPRVNAFALPGGYIYVTRGILAYLNSEDELAAVLGHEIGHVTARHAVRQHSTSTLTGIAGAILASQSGVQGAGDIANILGTALVRGYGREHELEADRLGAQYLARTGYSPDAMFNVIRVLKKQEEFESELAILENREPRTYHGLFSTHPDNDKRLKSIIKASKAIKPGNGKPQSDKNTYLEMIDGITFGNSSSEGVIRGQRFYHQELGFTLELPPGWHIKNRPDRLIAASPNNDGLMVLTVQDRNRKISARQFIKDRLGMNNLKSGESFDHNGLQGYTTIALADSDFGRRQARVIVLFYGNRAYVIAGVAKEPKRPYLYDSLYLKSGHSFRPLKEDEKQHANARKLVVRTYSNQSYSQLAKRSGLNHLAESQIRLLNADYPDGEPLPGELFKAIE